MNEKQEEEVKPIIIKRKSKQGLRNSKRERDEEESTASDHKHVEVEETVEPKRQKITETPTRFSTRRERGEMQEFIEAKTDASRQEQSDQGATRIFDVDGPALVGKVNPLVNIPKRKPGRDSHMTGIGPLKGNLHIRISARFDYQPDICKDYLETGFCGWGDNCKFAHIREDYKSGWQLEKEWEQEQKQKKLEKLIEQEEAGGEEEEEQKKKEDEIPFACYICREEFREPVVTNCKHYFCADCIMGQYQKLKDPLCPVCGQNTHGNFPTAHEIVKRMKMNQKEQ